MKLTNPTRNEAKKPWPFFLKWSNLLLVIFLLTLVHYWQTRESLSVKGTNPAPTFNLPTLKGEFVSNQAHRKAPTLYYFFAPWCNICHLSIENINSLREDLRSHNINIYIIALDWRNINEVKAFVDQHQLPVPVLLGTQVQTKAFKIKGFPTYYITDANDQLKWVSVGYSTSLGLKARIALTQ